MRTIALVATFAAICVAQTAHAADNIYFFKDSCLFGEAGKFDSDVTTTANCTYGNACKNDQARTLVIMESVKPGTIIRVWDNSDGSAKDDWAEIIIRSYVKNFPYGMCIQSFETSRSGPDYEIIYHRENGLDGKISRIQIIPAPAPKVPPVGKPRLIPRKAL